MSRVSTQQDSAYGTRETIKVKYETYFDEYYDDEEEECHACLGTGLDRWEIDDCAVCWGEGVIVVAKPPSLS